MWMWLYHRAEEGFHPLAVMWPKGGAWHLEQNVLHPLRVSFSDAQRPGGKVFILLPVQRSALRTYKAFLFSGFTNNVTTKQSHETGYQCHRLTQDFLTYLRVRSHERGGVCIMWDEAHSLPTIRAPGRLKHHLWRMFCVRWTRPSVCSSAACFFHQPQTFSVRQVWDFSVFISLSEDNISRFNQRMMKSLWQEGNTWRSTRSYLIPTLTPK